MWNLFKVENDNDQRSWGSELRAYIRPLAMTEGSYYLREEGQPSLVASHDLGVTNSMPTNVNLKQPNSEDMIGVDRKHSELLIVAFKSPEYSNIKSHQRCINGQ